METRQTTATSSQAAFVRALGHVLRSELNTIAATGTLFQVGAYTGGTPLLGEPLDAIRRMNQSTDRLTRLIDKVLLYIRAQGRASTFVSCPIPLIPFLDNAILRAPQPARVRIHRTLETSAPESVTGDPAQLGVIVDELIGNACQFSTDGQILLQARGGNSGQWHLTVYDRGIGVGPSDLPHVFVPFFRGEQAKRLVPNGYGLGLSIVHEMVRAMNGEVVLTSTPGHSTSVTLILPLVIPARLE